MTKETDKTITTTSEENEEEEEEEEEETQFEILGNEEEIEMSIIYKEEDQNNTEQQQRLNTIGSRQPTIIKEGLEKLKRITYYQRSKEMIAKHEETPRTYKKALELANK
ncbi:hypothetical protein O181_003286 [Austropuccinia psidii MF-1]|uniref:Uncharacterized protein n=1 Tax=Austropuccinia psidii MF-1 TaxID=1389203 RepID=A0A9Q3GE07_9BASI|nr:hypothetical protein [Austropuccinia psidii MF-1]